MPAPYRFGHDIVQHLADEEWMRRVPINRRRLGTCCGDFTVRNELALACTALPGAAFRLAAGWLDVIRAGARL